jgi:hypothetical protein
VRIFVWNRADGSRARPSAFRTQFGRERGARNAQNAMPALADPPQEKRSPMRKAWATRDGARPTLTAPSTPRSRSGQRRLPSRIPERDPPSCECEACKMHSLPSTKATTGSSRNTEAETRWSDSQGLEAAAWSHSPPRSESRRISQEAPMAAWGRSLREKQETGV